MATGGILKQARKDANRYITKGGFEDDIILESADGLTTLNLTGFVSKHWINMDTDGNAANSKNAHVTLSEDALIAAGYPYRNADKEVFLQGHKVSTPDSSLITKEYVIIEWFPDETLGLIACILGDYDSN